MRINLFAKKTLPLVVSFLITVLFACKKDGKLSPDFDNGNLSVVFVDTFSLKTSVLEESKDRADISANYLLGVYNDPIFGVKSSAIYSNVGLSGATTNLGSNVTIDSIVLTLDPTGYYGNSSSSLSVDVYELSTPLISSTGYSTDDYSPVESTLLGNGIYTPGSTDEILTLADSVMHKNHLRVNLNNPAFMTKMSNNTSLSSSTFNTIFKGIYIVTSDTAANPSNVNQGEGAISYFDLNAALSGIVVYYSNSVSTSSSSLQEKFILNSDIKSYNRFSHNYTSTDVEKHLNNDPGKNTNRIYVSAMKGVRTKIEIPNIKNLANEGNISINKAEITFTLEDGTDASPDEVLSTLALTGIDSEGNALALLDDPTLEGLEHYGGIYNESTKTITFNISKHVHHLIKNPTATDYGMYLTARKSLTTANRAVFNSENSPAAKIKLEITYSKL